ncbi:hypothetical protein FEM48_Zijuj11G0144400 [Ziziphus jujuba var. spinosa]|uniref:Uncharacterized protein n=1 Tax=Ziziphus jujuba var. spinosa TaxID=714518 RepID=A0A978UJG7_ZIZJJ|nr:hypothetical protein FEM48_Zijuj11G0144400 [Ziziphus jujuba var. spinosa]
MSHLKRLFLWDCLSLEKIPEIQYDCLSPLETLKINGCLRLKSIPEVPSGLKTLEARNCTSLLNGSGPYINISFQFNFKTKMNNDHPLNVYNNLKMSLEDTIYPDHHVFMKYQTIDLERAFATKWSSVCRNGTEASCRVFIQGKGIINLEIKKCGLELFNKWGARKN